MVTLAFTREPQYKSIPARSLRVGMFLFMPAVKLAIEITQIDEIRRDQDDNPIYYRITGKDFSRLKQPGDLVDVIEEEYDF